MIEAAIALGFLINNIAWMIFLYMFIPEKKIHNKLPKVKIQSLIPGQKAPRPDVIVPAENADPHEILNTIRGNK